MRLIAALIVLMLSCGVSAATSSPPIKPTSPTPAPAAQKQKTAAEIDAMIKKAGESQPDWWGSVQLNYPKTLDLTWQQPPKGEPWTPSKWLGQYVWSVINENPSKWKEGARLMHHVLTVNAKDPDKLKQSMNSLAHIYGDLMMDYERAAYWLKKAGAGVDISNNSLDLANCYLHMGAKDMAIEVLKKQGIDDTRHGYIIKLWADCGDYAQALKLAEEKAKNGSADIAWLMAGDCYRQQGKFTEALDFYKKVLTVDKGGRDIKQTKQRATCAIEAITLYERLDLKKIPDGVYTGNSVAYGGVLNVSVTVKGAVIADVKVTNHQEKQFYGALTDTPAAIIKKQTVKGIDTFASATITSEAIINATAKALASGVK
jgi:uncharacterized protein with FMN-binding domain